MPFAYRIHPRENLIVKKFKGAITVREVLESFDRLDADPRFHDSMLELDCLKDLDELQITAQDQRKLLDLIRLFSSRKPPASRKAMVAPFGLGRVAALRVMEQVRQGNSVQIGTFSDLPTALEFLGRKDLAKTNLFDWLVATVH